MLTEKKIDRDRSKIISVALVGVPRNHESLLKIEKALEPLRDRYEFIELLFVDHIQHRSKAEPLLGLVADSRFIWTGDDIGFYALRSVAANEAIGDLVLISNVKGFDASEALKMLEDGTEDDFVFFRKRRGFVSGFFRTLSSLSSYDIDPAYNNDMIINRLALEKLNRLHEMSLAFRFPNQANADSNRVFKAKSRKRERSSVRRWAELIVDIVFSSIGSIFMGLTFLSAISVMFGVSYLIYAVFVFLSDFTVQPGWFSTSVVLSVFTIVFGLFVFSASIFFIYFAKLLKQNKTPSYNVVASDDGLRLFSKLKAETNVV